MRSALIGILGAALVTAPFSVRAQAVPQIRLKPAATKLADEFSSIVSLRELADGRVLVVDVTDSKVVVVDFAAGTVTQIGRNGQGPGEYQIPGPLFPIGGDSTLMIERRSGRWHLFHGAQIAKTLPADDATAAVLRRIGTGADARGNVIRAASFTNDNAAVAASTLPESSWVMRVNRRTSRVDTLARVKNVKSIMSTTTNNAGAITSVTVTRAPYAVGEEIVLFEDGWLAVARLDPYRVDWIAPDRQVTKGRPLSWPAQKISQRDLEAFFEVRGRGKASATTPQAEDALRKQIESDMKILPEALPPVALGGLTPVEDGRLLIRHPETAALPNARYDLVDRRGALVGTIAMPKGESIIAISRKWAYVAATDDDGLQFLRRHPWP